MELHDVSCVLTVSCSCLYRLMCPSQFEPVVEDVSLFVNLWIWGAWVAEWLSCRQGVMAHEAAQLEARSQNNSRPSLRRFLMRFQLISNFGETSKWSWRAHNVLDHSMQYFIVRQNACARVKRCSVLDPAHSNQQKRAHKTFNISNYFRLALWFVSEVQLEIINTINRKNEPNYCGATHQKIQAWSNENIIGFLACNFILEFYIARRGNRFRRQPGVCDITGTK